MAAILQQYKTFVRKHPSLVQNAERLLHWLVWTPERFSGSEYAYESFNAAVGLLGIYNDAILSEQPGQQQICACESRHAYRVYLDGNSVAVVKWWTNKRLRDQPQQALNEIRAGQSDWALSGSTVAPVLLQATEQWGMSAVYVDAGVDMTERFNGLRTTGGDHAVHQEIQHYLASVLVALEALHTQGLILRDIKPNNVFFCPQDQCIRLGDCGLLADLGCDKTGGDLHLPHLDMCRQYEEGGPLVIDDKDWCRNLQTPALDIRQLFLGALFAVVPKPPEIDINCAEDFLQDVFPGCEASMVAAYKELDPRGYTRILQKAYLRRCGSYNFAPLIDAAFSTRPDLATLMKSVLTPFLQSGVPTLTTLLSHSVLAESVAAARAQQQQQQGSFMAKSLVAHRVGSAVMALLSGLHQNLQQSGKATGGLSLCQQVKKLGQRYRSLRFNRRRRKQLQHDEMLPIDAAGWAAAAAAASVYSNSSTGRPVWMAELEAAKGLLTDMVQQRTGIVPAATKDQHKGAADSPAVAADQEGQAASPAAAAGAVVSLPVPLRTAVAVMVLPESLSSSSPLPVPAVCTSGDMAQPAEQQQQQPAALQAHNKLSFLLRRAAATAATVSAAQSGAHHHQQQQQQQDQGPCLRELLRKAAASHAAAASAPQLLLVGSASLAERKRQLAAALPVQQLELQLLASAAAASKGSPLPGQQQQQQQGSSPADPAAVPAAQLVPLRPSGSTPAPPARPPRQTHSSSEPKAACPRLHRSSSQPKTAHQTRSGNISKVACQHHSSRNSSSKPKTVSCHVLERQWLGAGATARPAAAQQPQKAFKHLLSTAAAAAAAAAQAAAVPRVPQVTSPQHQLLLTVLPYSTTTAFISLQQQQQQQPVEQCEVVSPMSSSACTAPSNSSSSLGSSSPPLSPVVPVDTPSWTYYNPVYNARYSSTGGGSRTGGHAKSQRSCWSRGSNTSNSSSPAGAVLSKVGLGFDHSMGFCPAAHMPSAWRGNLQWRSAGGAGPESQRRVPTRAAYTDGGCRT